MSMVLTPILKTSISEKISTPGSPLRVTFNLPDEDNIIEYLKNEEIPYFKKINSIATRIQATDTNDSILLKWICDFKDNISLLENNHGITKALLNMKWYSKGDDFVKPYQDLILHIVSAYPLYTKDILSTTVKIFCLVDTSKENITDNEDRIFQNAHKLLKCIIKVVPTCEYTLCVILREKFPYMKHHTKVLYSYVRNLLTMCSYLPSKRLAILECIVEKLIHIDVNCSRIDIEVAECEKEDTENLMEQDENSDQLSKSNVMAHPLAHTLDILIDTLFQYIKNTCLLSDGVTLDWDATKKLYKELLTVFDKIILPTHGSCHVQYLLFYICSLKQDLSDGFLDYLWKRVQNPSAGPVLRQQAAFYIGSFLARAKYVSINTVIAAFDLMCSWIHSYIDNHTVQDLNVHGTFHSVCQTIFYVFAFRSQELLELDKGFKFLRSLNLDRIVTCRLNPLRYCDRNIVQNFANIARNFQIAYVYPVIERNNRNLLYSGFEMNSEHCAGSMIKTFFPFDPYLLKRSKHWIESNYRTYNHCHKDDESMDSVDADETMADSLFSYGSSPGFKKSFLLRRY